MTIQINASWYSRRGKERTTNCDACAVLTTSTYCLALVADAIESCGAQPEEYASEWMRQLIRQIADDADPSKDSILTKMGQAQRQLREQFPTEKACYSALLVRRNENVGWAFSCGDCRVGAVSAQGDCTWKTPVHSKANWRGEEFSDLHANSPDRYLVTRTLNSKRFDQPSVVPIQFDPTTSWLLATDGYWIEESIYKTSRNETLDDSSVLKISLGAKNWTPDSDCKNWYVHEK